MASCEGDTIWIIFSLVNIRYRYYASLQHCHSSSVNIKQASQLWQVKYWDNTQSDKQNTQSETKINWITVKCLFIFPSSNWTNRNLTKSNIESKKWPDFRAACATISRNCCFMNPSRHLCLEDSQVSSHHLIVCETLVFIDKSTWLFLLREKRCLQQQQKQYPQDDELKKTLR